MFEVYSMGNRSRVICGGCIVTTNKGHGLITHGGLTRVRVLVDRSPTRCEDVEHNSYSTASKCVNS